MDDWSTSATLLVLQQRALIIQDIRNFMTKSGLLEVETPILAPSTISDPNIESYRVQDNDNYLYLQTSPEFHMKRLLSSIETDIFQISKVFRHEESGAIHNPEFTMLEWYRIGIDYHALMDETYTLISTFIPLKKKKLHTKIYLLKVYKLTHLKLKLLNVYRLLKTII